MTRRTWVVVADGGRARVFDFDTRGALHLVPELKEEGPHRPSHEIGSDAPGRSFAGAHSTRRGAMEPKMPLDRQAERAFLASFVKELEAAHSSGAFGALIIIAPPGALGEIRAGLSPRLAEAVIATSPHDFTKHPVEDIRHHVLSLDGVPLLLRLPSI